MRTLEIWDGGEEEALTGFARDGRAEALVAAQPGGERAIWRLWRRPRAALSLGRYHRLAEGRQGLEQRARRRTSAPVGPLRWRALQDPEPGLFLTRDPADQFVSSDSFAGFEPINAVGSDGSVTAALAILCVQTNC